MELQNIAAPQLTTVSNVQFTECVLSFVSFIIRLIVIMVNTNYVSTLAVDVENP